MFILYMDDVIDPLIFVKISMYPDDCVLFLSGNNWVNVHDSIQKILMCLILFFRLKNTSFQPWLFFLIEAIP